ncbi:MAG TPA: hypothetical protein ENI64_13510 [Gammaproteobacteria bacterium]|nr:hypothetical protein [Gammaproteobacteria bacterium]
MNINSKLFWLTRFSLFMIFFVSVAAVNAQGPGGSRKALLGHNSVWLSSPGRSDWAPLSVPGQGPVESLVRDTRDPNRLLLCQNGQLHISQDSGRSWNNIVFDSGTEKATAAAFHPTKPGMLFLATNQRFLISSDSGQSWTSTKPALTFKWQPRSIHVPPAKPSRIYFTTRGDGIFRSDDEGKSWRGINSGLPGAIGAAPVAPVESVAIHPSNPDVMYVAIEAKGVYKTTDGGGRWNRVSNGLPINVTRRTFPWKLAIDQQKPNRLLVAASWPVHSEWVKTAIFLSVDAGRNWKEVGTSQKPVLDIGFAPENIGLAVIVTEDGLVNLSR